MLEAHVLTDDEKTEIEGKFLGLYDSGNYKGVLRFYEGLNKPAKAYIDKRYHWELLNARTASKREGKKSTL